MTMTGQQDPMKLAEALRPELTAFCYRMLGSVFDADDAVQDTFIRVWKSWDDLRSESSFRHWIYRIATNVCLDKLRNAKRRALPMDLSSPTHPEVVPTDTSPHGDWIWPVPDISDDPAELTIQRHTIRLAFIAVLQRLPHRQRAVLILSDVFRWSASETGEAMGMTTAAVNSALQRARATMEGAQLTSDALRDLDAEVDRQVLDRYVDAFERYDIDALMELFHENVSLSMPPFVMWVQGRSNLASFYEMTRSHCLGSVLLPTRANGNPAFAQYVPSEDDGSMEPWGIHVLEIKEGKISHIHTFISADLYPRFGLPERLQRGTHTS